MTHSEMSILLVARNRACIHAVDGLSIAMPLPPPRTGVRVKVSNRIVPFSFWPTVTNAGRHKTQPMLFVHDPWGALESRAISKYSDSALGVAISFLNQARVYFAAGKRASAIESKPLLFYYSFLNLLKFCALEHAPSIATSRVYHGLKIDDLTATITTASLTAHASGNNALNAYDELLGLLGVDRIDPNQETLLISDLMESQIIGHRIWCEAKGGRNEHFVAVDRLELWEEKTNQELWIRMAINSSDLSQTGKRPLAALRDSGLEDLGWHRVESGDDTTHYFEMETPIIYGQRSSDSLDAVCSSVKNYLYKLISSDRPYRKYYLHLARPAREYGQLPSTYAMLFYLGSITRYRPRTFIDIMNGNYGGFVREQLAIQPDQMLYEFACLAMKQEVAKGALVST